MLWKVRVGVAAAVFSSVFWHRGVWWWIPPYAVLGEV